MVSIKIYYEGKSRSISMKGKTVEDAIFSFGVSPQTVLAKVNGDFAPDDRKLKNGDRLDLIRISSIG